jgi:hypothetical protein
MPSLIIPAETHASNGHGLNDELQAFLEAFSLLEFGAVSKELLSKIA